MIRIVVASGKGGTGKTLVATALALVAAQRGSAALIDADVEAPNAGLFIHPVYCQRQDVEMLAPVVDADLCTHCGRCAEVCAFHAIASLPDRTLVFEEMCHGCGSCMLNCPAGAISEMPHPIGVIHAGQAGPVPFAEGELQVGEAMATPIIHQLGRFAEQERYTERDWLIVDSPPGTACPVIETLRLADVALLVTEPTPFGLHDLRLAVNLARDVLGVPVGVVLNKDDGLDRSVEDYCQGENLPVLLRIPYRREIAESYSRGQSLLASLPEYTGAFGALLDQAAALCRPVMATQGGGT
ncbi:MAG: ATP-binding protein [Anaerolineae bacterium]